MSKRARVHVEKMMKKMEEYNVLETTERLLMEKEGLTFEQLKEKSLFTAWRTTNALIGACEGYAAIYAERDKAKYYNPDGTLNEELVESRYNEVIYKGETNDYEEAKDYLFNEKWDIKCEIKELTELFSDADCLLYNTKVYEKNDGNLALVFEYKSIASDGVNGFFTFSGAEVLIFDEKLWPPNEEIHERNNKIKGIVQKDVSKHKKYTKLVYIDYEKMFEYTFGKPKYIQYYMEQLPEEVLAKYKGKKWTLHLFLIHMYTGDIGGYTARDEGYVDMLIDYDQKLDIIKTGEL